MAGLLEGKVALVTGGASGIGRASALALAREGAKVVVSDVAAEGGEKVVREVREQGGEATFVKADVGRGEEVRELVERTVREYGGLDVAHNNAGIGGSYAKTESYPEEEFDRVISVNLKSVWLGMKYEIPHLLARGGGSIVNTASAAGLVGLAYNAAYTASKHGVVGLTKAASQEYARQNVRINAVCPGFVETPLVAEALEDFASKEALVRAHPVGRLGEAGEVAEAVVWLASDAASFVTGTTLSIDGGLTSR